MISRTVSGAPTRSATAGSATRSREDSAGRLEEYYLGQAATGLWEDTDALIAQLEAVTPERVAEAARSIRLDTVYFLTGKEGAAQ